MNQPSIITTKLNIVTVGSNVSVSEQEKAGKILHIVGLVFTYAFLIVAAFIALLPFYYMIIGSFMQEQDLISGKLWPETGSFFQNIADNYSETLNRFSYSRYVGNTLIVAVTTTLLMMIVTIFSAFAFARLKFRGRDLLFTIFLATMMIPGEMMVISNYITVAAFGWIGSGQTLIEAYAAMIVPFWISVFYIYLLRQNFKQIPNELYLAAKVDGKSDWNYLWKVMVPLAAPTLISITILKFMGTWNSYVWPNLVTNDVSYRLISNGLRGSSFQDLEAGRTEYGYQMAATVIVTVPLFLLFVFFRKYIMKGVGRAGIKG